MAIFRTRGGNSNPCEFNYLPVLKQTVKVQFSLDVFGKKNFKRSRRFETALISS